MHNPSGIVGSVIFIIVIAGFSCKSDWSGHDAYYGQGFGMGYASGCFDTSDYMKRDLNLDDRQVEKITSIDSEYRKMYYENRSNFDKINDLRSKHQAEIEAILTPAQRIKFTDIYRDRWSGWGIRQMYRHMGGYYGAGYGMGFASGCFGNRETMKDELDLTNIQMNAIDEIDKEYRDKYYRNRNDYDMIEKLRREQKAAIEKTLTSDQKKKFEEIYNNRWYGRGMHRGMGGMMHRMRGGMMWP